MQHSYKVSCAKRRTGHEPGNVADAAAPVPGDPG